MKKFNKGITLISLIVTIIVLIILAGISINILLGENGILKKTGTASIMQKKAKYFEEINLEISDTHIIKNTDSKAETFINSLKNKLDGKDWIESANKYVNDTVLVVETKDGYQIYIDIDNTKNTAIIRDNSFGKIAKNVTLTYSANGGEGTEQTQSVRPGLAFALQESKYSYLDENYVFGGWEDRSKGLTYISGDYITINENTTIYAVWTKDKSTLTINSNDGENKTTIEHIKIGNTYIVPENLYNREGYSFKKWNTNQNGTGTDYAPGDLITVTSNNLELYAIWEPIKYTISYNLDGGTATNPSIYTIESDSFTLNEPSKDEYYFTGWTGSNGNTPQKELIIAKGSTGDKIYKANFAQYSPASLRTFNESDKHVSWSFNTSTGIYTIKQTAKSSGWGDGVICDNSTTAIEWEKNYMLEFEIKTPARYTLKTDGNTMFVSDGQGNDIYGTSWLIVDGVRTDGNGYGKLPQSTVIDGGTWHKVQMYLINNNTTENPNHKAIKSYSGFALDLSSVTSDVTYEIRNLKSTVY